MPRRPCRGQAEGVTALAGQVTAGWLSRLERFDVVASTNDVVAEWLRGGTPEVCVAIADEQSAGRGRSGRTWRAPHGAALLCSIGFRPAWLAPDRLWQLGATVSLAMADAAEGAIEAPRGAIRLKWPNDLVAVEPRDGGVRKLAGVLGETDGLGADDPTAVIGIGLNAGWRRADFPAELADSMTSLAELAGDHPIDREAVVDAFLERLGPLVEALRGGAFPADTWRDRQLTNGLLVRLEWPDGSAETVSAVDVDPESGALLVRAPGSAEAPRPVLVGEIRHVRVGGVV
jgi:BirA family transcriptional regulator, biotin operon repressor / biotin---[acetyl-CoA-carboxylase] ligase